VTGIIGPLDATVIPRFAEVATFARLPRATDAGPAAIAVLGVPFDGGASYRPGTRFGPAHVRECSRLLRPFNPAGEVPVFTTVQIVDAGDVACNPFDIRAAVAAVEHRAGAILAAGTQLVTIGGDHTITLPLLRAAAREHGPLALVHVDAHLDTWDTYFGAEYTHGTPFRRAAEEGLLDPDRCLHIGIRGPLYAAEDLAADRAFGFEVITARQVERIGVDAVIARIHERVAGGTVYASIDIDSLDPAFAPGTGTPEPGGLSSRELLEIIRGLHHLPVVAADLVEVSPAYDHAQITGLAGAHVVYELLTAMVAGRR